jgi:gliding motility-associated protein GldM
MGSDAKGKLRLRADQVGEQEVKGVIRVEGPNGPEEHPYSVKYQVMVPFLVASAIKMNVLYRGVDNPLELSVPGVPVENIHPFIDNGTITRSAGGWMARVNTNGKAHVTVSTVLPDGSSRTIGPVEFRVKDLPAPMAFMGGKNARDNTIKLTDLRAAQGVVAKLENTEFNEPFKVTSFTLTVLHAGIGVPHRVRSNTFDANGDARTARDAARVGDRVYIEDIKARLTSGVGIEYALPTIALKVVQ